MNPYVVWVNKMTCQKFLEFYGWVQVDSENNGKPIKKYKCPKSGELALPHIAVETQMNELIGE